MKLISLKCPNCNCTMQVNPEKKEVECVYCGTKFAIDDEKQHLKIENAEQLGYELEKGRMRAQAEQKQQEKALKDETLSSKSSVGETNNSNEIEIRHSFKLGISFLIWIGISLLSVGLVIAIMFKNPENIFKGYEEAKTTLTVITGIISLIVSTISLYINWISTSLLLFAGFRAGGNKEVTYRSVLYYFLKNAWFFAVWIALILAGTLIFGTKFVTSIPSAIITLVIMFALYFFIFKKINGDFTLQKKWVYFIFAGVIALVVAGTLLYTGTIDYAGEIKI